jgi:phosphoserine phosphatase
MDIKLVFFDMEGTLFRRAVEETAGSVAPSAWQLLAERLGAAALKEEKQTRAKWNRGEYSGYLAWCEETLRIFQRHGLTRGFFDEVIATIDYNPGVHETLGVLRGRGIRTALISGGFKAQANRAQVDLKIDHAFAACELFWDERDRLEHWNLLPCDYEGKRDFMKLIMKEHGLSQRECAFVGDGINDVPFARAVGVSIAFNGPQQLRKVCTYAVQQPAGKEDFAEILRCLKL